MVFENGDGKVITIGSSEFDILNSIFKKYGDIYTFHSVNHKNITIYR